MELEPKAMKINRTLIGVAAAATMLALTGCSSPADKDDSTRDIYDISSWDTFDTDTTPPNNPKITQRKHFSTLSSDEATGESIWSGSLVVKRNGSVVISGADTTNPQKGLRAEATFTDLYCNKAGGLDYRDASAAEDTVEDLSAEAVSLLGVCDEDVHDKKQPIDMQLDSGTLFLGLLLDPNY